MALPTTITDAVAPDNTMPQSYVGPFISSAGNVYVVAFRDDAGTTRPTVFKATDPTLSFSIVGTGTEPGANDHYDSSISVEQSGDILRVVYQFNVSASAEKSLHTWEFDMATDSWSNGVSIAPLTNVGSDGLGNVLGCDVAFLSDGTTIRVVAQGNQIKEMGTFYSQVVHYVSTDGGATWSAATTVNGAAIDDYTGPRIVTPPSNADQCMIFYRQATSNTGLMRGLSSAGTLRTERSITSGLTPIYPYSKARGFTRSTTSKVRVLFGLTSELRCLSFDAFSDDSNPAKTLALVDSNTPQNVFNSMAGSLGIDTSTVQSVFARSSDSDLYSANDQDTDTWTTPQSEFVGTINFVSANVFTRSGNVVLAYLTLDGLTFKYNELVLSASSGQIKIINEALAAAEAQARLRDLGRLTSETLDTTEVASRPRVLARLRDEALGLTETVSRVRARLASIVEAMGITETASSVVQALLVRVLDELVGAAEQTFRFLALNRLEPELVGLGDTSTKTLSLFRATTDNLGTSETRVKVRAILRRASEIEGLSETKQAIKGLFKVLGEVVAIGDSSEAKIVLVRIADEAVALTETTISLLAAAVSRVVSEAVGLTETTATKIKALLVRVTAEAVSVVESLSQLRDLVRFRDEGVSSSELSLFSRIMARLSSQSLTVSEVLKRPRVLSRLSDEGVGLTVQLVRSRVVRRIVSATIALSEVTAGIVAQLVETLICGMIEAQALLGASVSTMTAVEGTPEHQPAVAGTPDSGTAVGGSASTKPAVVGTAKSEECE